MKTKKFYENNKTDIIKVGTYLYIHFKLKLDIMKWMVVREVKKRPNANKYVPIQAAFKYPKQQNNGEYLIL